MKVNRFQVSYVLIAVCLLQLPGVYLFLISFHAVFDLNVWILDTLALGVSDRGLLSVPFI